MSDILMELGSVKVPAHEGLQLTQQIEEIGGITTKRMLSGAARRSQHWRKLRITINGQGWIPPGLTALDYSQQLVLKCPGLRGVTSTSNVITLPAARRSDAGFEPAACALVDDAWQEATISNVAVDDYTITAVAGATLYRVDYYPQITVLAELNDTGQLHAATYTWRLLAEEV